MIDLDRPRRWWRGRPLQTRVGSITALIVGLGIALTAIGGYATVAYQLNRSIDQGLLLRAEQAQETPLSDPSALIEQPAEIFLATQLRAAVVGSNGNAYFPRDDDGVIAPPPVGREEVAVAAGRSERSLRTATVDGNSFRVVAVPTEPGFSLVLAQPTEPTDDVLDRLQIVSLVVGSGGVAVGAWAGVRLVRTALRPVRTLTAAAEHVAATGRLDPIAVEGHDELGRLAAAFNTMLGALDAARAQQSRLVADAGHELRTPLTSLRTNLELLAQSDQREPEGRLPAEEREGLLADVRAQVEELSTLVADLVELSRQDALTASVEQVDFLDLVRDAVTRVQRRAPRGVEFELHGESWVIDGDSALLSRAITNLLDNAAKYSSPDGTIRITLRDGVLDVADDGPGIAEPDLPYVFDRFYRSEDSRGRPGSGLGLAIVRAAALRHGGSVTASRSGSGGALLRLTVPAASSVS